MSYNKTDGSSQYNKEERGGWYCTNPKRHEENQQHHAADEPHVHHAERNDIEPQRQPQARPVRPARPASQKPTIEEPVSPKPVTDKKKKTGCQIAIIILIWTIVMPFIISAILTMFLDDDSDSQEEDYYEYYDENLEPEESDSLFVTE